MHRTVLVRALVLAAWVGGYMLTASPATAQATREFGIDRSNLTRESEAMQEKTLQDVHALHATWFRDVLSGTTPQTVAKFVNEVKLAKQNKLKFLANVLAAQADYDEGYQNQNAGEAFRKRCGWSQGSSRLSQINLAKLARRLRMQFDAVKAANLTIDAFEIGNEADWICFNGDVPDGHTPTEAQLMTAVRGYAHFLKAAAEVIHDQHYFPNAKIITFGIAHGSDRWDRPPHHFSNPARMVALLRNLDGFNYLDNAIYHVDGYGTHIYPNPDNLEQSVTDLVRQDAAILGPDKPFWITEWGLGANQYPNKHGQTRSEGIRNFYAVLDTLHIPFGPPFYYAYNLLIDAKGAMLPEASAIAARVTGQSLDLVPAHAEGAVLGVNLSDIGLNQLMPIYQSAKIKPAVVQVESHPYLPETELLEFCNENDIVFLAFAPLGHGIRPGRLEDPVISAIATPFEKTPAQVPLSWAVQRGTALHTTPKTAVRARKNLNISVLPEDAFNKINHIQTRQRLNEVVRTGIPGFISRGRST